MLKIQNVTGGYSNNPILRNIDIEVQNGDFFALLGPNGSGKTTLFKLITGQLPIQKGKVLLSGKDISSYSKLEKAKKIAVLSQDTSVSFDYTVEEIVSLGRYPHQKGILKNLSKKDWHIIEEVMELTKVTEFRHTQFRKISGGEKQRVLLAKALAQEPELLLLDEPTNHLDIKHTFQLLDLLKKRQEEKGLTIFSILHDLNVASLYADRFALLYNGSLLKVGDASLLKEVDTLNKIYQVQIHVQAHPTVPKPQLLLAPSLPNSPHSTFFKGNYKINNNEQFVHVQFQKPLRTISNGMFGNGIQWIKDYCIFSCKQHSTIPPEEEIQTIMEQYSITPEQTVATIVEGNIGDVVVVEREIEDTKILIIVTPTKMNEKIRGFNMMVFMDGYFNEGVLVNSLLIATKEKMKAMQQFGMDEANETNEALYLAVTQKGDKSVTQRAVEATLREMVQLAVKQVYQKEKVVV